MDWWPQVKSMAELCCCNLSGGVALIVRFTTNGMCYCCCYGAKLCAHAARDFRSQQNGAVTRMWRSCLVQPHTKNVRSLWFVVKRRWCCCTLSGGVALIVWFTTNGMCVKNNTIIYVAWASNGKRDCEHDHYRCLLPRCEALRTCHSGFPIATVYVPYEIDQEIVEVVIRGTTRHYVSLRFYQLVSPSRIPPGQTRLVRDNPC